MKIVFMGTPDFAVPVLKAIIEAGHQVGYVVTQPDKARNRGKKIQFTPVKEVAVENGIEVLQPEKIKKSSETIETLKNFNPDIIVVVAYGQLIQKEILELPKYGCVNVHASLLPKLRGAAPIQHAILSGEEKTGVTIMQMAEGLDTGDMLTKAEVVIGEMNGEELHDVLSVTGAALLVETLEKIEMGEIIPEKQDDSISTYAKMIFKEDGKIDWNQEPIEIRRKIKAFDPWPGAFCLFGDKTMKIWKADVIDKKSSEEAGTVVEVTDAGIDIACKNGLLRVSEIQLPGKKRVNVKDYLRGNSIEKGITLG